MNLDKEDFIDLVKKNPINLILVLIALILVGVYLFRSGYFVSAKKLSEAQSSLAVQSLPKSKNIFVDIEGAVVNPGIYEIEEGSRINDVVILAGGFSDDVDLMAVMSDLNRAQKLADATKVFIPFLGIDAPKSDQKVDPEEPSIININTSNKADLEALPGIGAVTADKIIDNRPYLDLSELKSKKIVGESVYEKIKELISI